MNCVLHIFIFILYTNNINYFQVTKKQLFDVQNLSETMRQTYNNYDFYFKKKECLYEKVRGKSSTLSFDQNQSHIEYRDDYCSYNSANVYLTILLTL